MRSNKYINYYYKTSDISAIDEIEKKQFENYNDYGYNFGSSKRRIIDYEMNFKKNKHKVNQSVFNNK